MKIYAAGNTALVSREINVLAKTNRRLYSYFYILPGQIQHNAWKYFKNKYIKKDEK
jgi:hypothetical protein